MGIRNPIELSVGLKTCGVRFFLSVGLHFTTHPLTLITPQGKKFIPFIPQLDSTDFPTNTRISMRCLPAVYVGTMYFYCDMIKKKVLNKNESYFFGRF